MGQTAETAVTDEAAGEEGKSLDDISKEDLATEIIRLRRESNEHQLAKCQMERQRNDLRDRLLESQNADGRWQMVGDPEVDAAKVVDAFSDFRRAYYTFKEEHGLSHKMDFTHEVITGIVDKLGRVARDVKHYLRDEERPNWRLAIEKNMTGVLAYLIVLGHNLDIDWTTGMHEELLSALKQHAAPLSVGEGATAAEAAEARPVVTAATEETADGPS